MVFRQWCLCLCSLTLLMSGCKHSCFSKRRSSPVYETPIPPVPGPGSSSIRGGTTIPPAGIGERPSNAIPREEILLPEKPFWDNSPPKPSPSIQERPASPQSNQGPGRTSTSRKIDAAPAGAPSQLPVGIASFSVMGDRLWAGLKPDLDGLDWLQKQGVQKVVFLRLESEDDSADAQQVMKRGMQFTSLVVSPEKMNRDLFDEFENKIAGDRPVFVYDRDLAYQGYYWYAHFRIKELYPADASRIRAEKLGFREGTKLAEASQKLAGNYR